MSEYHLMLDLETMGTRTDASIIQIGAVLFRPDRDESIDQLRKQAIDIPVNLASNIALGRAIRPETIAFWLEQNDEARLKMAKNVNSGKDLPDALKTFELEVFNKVRGWDNIAGIWGHGATFDVTILQSAYEAIGRKVPWNYRNVRDTRTIFALVPELIKVNAPGLVPHDGVDDAIHQILRLKQALSLITAPRFE